MNSLIWKGFCSCHKPFEIKQSAPHLSCFRGRGVTFQKTQILKRLQLKHFKHRLFTPPPPLPFGKIIPICRGLIVAHFMTAVHVNCLHENPSIVLLYGNILELFSLSVWRSDFIYHHIYNRSELAVLIKWLMGWKDDIFGWTQPTTALEIPGLGTRAYYYCICISHFLQGVQDTPITLLNFILTTTRWRRLHSEIATDLCRVTKWALWLNWGFNSGLLSPSPTSAPIAHLSVEPVLIKTWLPQPPF